MSRATELLTDAAKKGDAKTGEDLLTMDGIEVIAKDADGVTALHSAVKERTQFHSYPASQICDQLNLAMKAARRYHSETRRSNPLQPSSPSVVRQRRRYPRAPPLLPSLVTRQEQTPTSSWTGALDEAVAKGVQRRQETGKNKSGAQTAREFGRKSYASRQRCRLQRLAREELGPSARGVLLRSFGVPWHPSLQRSSSAGMMRKGLVWDSERIPLTEAADLVAFAPAPAQGLASTEWVRISLPEVTPREEKVVEEEAAQLKEGARDLEKKHGISAMEFSSHSAIQNMVIGPDMNRMDSIDS